MPAVRQRAVVVALAIAWAVAGCDGSPVGEPARPAPDVGADAAVQGKASADVAVTTWVVGPEGAAIPLAQGGTLRIPAGAIVGPREISIRPLSAPTGDDFYAVGPFYAFEPAGLPLVVPAEVVLPFASDVAGAGAGAHGVAVAWSSDGRDWSARPSRVLERDRAIVSELSLFGRVGAAAFEPADGACCLVEGGCAVRTASACGGAFLGRGVACGGAEGATCERVRCCADASGHRFVLAGSCDGGVVSNERCELVCCPSSFASPLADPVPRGDCPAAEPPTPDRCAPVCCTVGDAHAVQSGVLFATDCDALADTLPLAERHAAVDDCPVCCADGWTRRRAGACERWRPPEQCASVCCDANGERRRIALGRCHMLAGVVLPEPSCRCDADTGCDDGDPCTADRCERKTGACSHGPILVPRCGDGCVTPPEDCEHDLQCGEHGKEARCSGCRCVK